MDYDSIFLSVVLLVYCLLIRRACQYQALSICQCVSMDEHLKKKKVCILSHLECPKIQMIIRRCTFVVLYFSGVHKSKPQVTAEINGKP